MNNALDNLIVIQASAGSGKTYRLTLEYLTLLFEGIRDENVVKYNSILVVTFTNKATVELRERILGKLFDLSRGTGDMETALLTALWGAGAVTDPTKKALLKDYASRALRVILEDYTYFRVQTIDSFFQEVVRSFVLEVDRLHGGFEVEIDKETIVTLSLEEMLQEITHTGSNIPLQEALKTLYDSKAEEDERVRLRKELARMMSRFVEDPLNPEVMKQAETYLDGQTVPDAIQQLSKIKESIEEYVLMACSETMELLNRLKNPPYSFPLSESSSRTLLFQYNKLNLPDREILKNWLRGSGEIIGGYIEKTLDATEDNPYAWVSKNRKAQYASILEEINTPLREQIQRLVSVARDDLSRRHYLSVTVMLKYLHWIPVLVQFREKLDEFQRENGIVLISEVNELLSDIIGKTDTPFVYDKVGTRIESYLIDEFQDTNATQWHNFLPLLTDSLANGHRNYIVGDVKQSIYRFRGGDSELLGETLPEAKGVENIEKLDKNYRSHKVIIDFNNAFFSGLYDFKGFVDEENIEDKNKAKERGYPKAVKEIGHRDSHETIYAPENVSQSQPEGSSKTGGFVSVRKQNFGQDDLRELITSLTRDGYKPGDIAILVRRNADAAKIADMLNSLATEVEGEEKEKFRFISNTALLISNAVTVQFLTAFLHYLAHPAVRSAKDLFEVTLFNLIPYSPEESAGYKNKLYTDLREKLLALSLTGLSLYELVNASIEVISTIRPIPLEEMVYVNAFLDKLFDFTGRYPSTYGKFDEWWQSKKDRLYIEMSTSSVNALQLHTIHNVKGLEFPVVILPYADWPIVSNASKTDQLKLYNVKKEVAPEQKDEVSTLPVSDAEDLTYPDTPDFFYYNSTPTVKNTDSLFLKSLAEELEADYMDSLNLLYVAFTRPSERLYVYMGKAEKDGKEEKSGDRKKIKLTGTGLIIARGVLRSSGYDFQDDDASYNLGQELPREVSEEKHQDEIISTLSATPRYDGLTMRKKRFSNSSIERGEVLHSFMEKVRVKTDIDTVFGDKADEYKEEIDAFKKATSAPDTPTDFFFTPQKGWITLSEYSMYSSTAGQTLRTDRLMLNPETHSALVLDYKFGAEKAFHKRQIKLYLQTLQEMGYRARGFLWYNFTKITEVTE